MSSSIKCKSSYCPLVWMFCSKPPWINWTISSKCLPLITSDYESNFNKLLKSSYELSIHKTCINYLKIEFYKYLHELPPELMTDIFTIWKNSYNIRNIGLFCYENLRSVRFGVDAIAFRAIQLWQKGPK